MAGTRRPRRTEGRIGGADWRGVRAGHGGATAGGEAKGAQRQKRRWLRAWQWQRLLWLLVVVMELLGARRTGGRERNPTVGGAWKRSIHLQSET